MWEYKVRYFGNHELAIQESRQVEKYLNEQGKDGWELVYIREGKFINDPTVTCNMHLYFKRRKDN